MELMWHAQPPTSSWCGMIWSIGVMGYWLVWDQRAQWLTNSISEALGGQVALTFASADSLRQSSTFFIIVLFLHIFLPTLIVLGMLFLVMRLARPRILAPRLLLIEMTVALLILTIWRPVTLDPPFDPDKLVGSVTLDVWYLDFLPLAHQWGWFFWGAGDAGVYVARGATMASAWAQSGAGCGDRRFVYRLHYRNCMISSR